MKDDRMAVSKLRDFYHKKLAEAEMEEDDGMSFKRLNDEMCYKSSSFQTFLARTTATPEAWRSSARPTGRSC